MIKNLLKKYLISTVLFTIFLLLLYYKDLNKTNIIPYINFLCYFITFLLINENLKYSKFNKYIDKLFYYLYGYLSIICSLLVITSKTKNLYNVVYLYNELILNLFMLTIPIYLILYSINNLNLTNERKITYSFIISLMILMVNHFQQIFDPPLFFQSDEWKNWIFKDYITNVISIFFLLIFWIRCYFKIVVLSEYLLMIIFLFTLLNMVETLNYIAFQWNLETWFKIQILTFFINILMIGLWYRRLVYLNSDIANENERYLMNFQYLNGIVSKPRKTWFSQLFSKFPLYSTLVIIGGLTIGLVVLYLIKKISFYLLLNTIFILLIILLALFFSFSSIKRDWNDQFDMFLKKNKK